MLGWGKEDLDLAETVGKSETKDEMQEIHTFTPSTSRVEGGSKRSLPQLLITTGLLPISPASQIPRWIRPKPRHCSEPWAAKAGNS